MTSCHYLEEQVYKGIQSKTFTGIHGTVNCRKKEIIKTQSSDVGLEFQVSRDWSGGLGLMVGIIGATRYAEENTDLPPYVVLTQPLGSPSLTANPSAAQICTLTDENNLLKKYWAVVRGFRRGVSKNIRNALYLEFFESLQHSRYNYLKVLPREYITNLKTNHFPIDVNKVAELKEHYNRGWECDENLRRFPKRLNEE